jgi:hypothetical protein
MQLTALIITIFVLLVIIWQDLRLRAIHWLTLPILFSGLSLLNYPISLQSILQNILFIGVVMIFVSIYVSIRNRKFINLTKRHFGLGDILFLIAITPVSESYLFMLLFISGTICTLIITFIRMAIKPQRNIPFAGYFSFFLIGFILVDYLCELNDSNFVLIGNN